MLVGYYNDFQNFKTAGNYCNFLNFQEIILQWTTNQCPCIQSMTVGKTIHHKEMKVKVLQTLQDLQMITWSSIPCNGSCYKKSLTVLHKLQGYELPFIYTNYITVIRNYKWSPCCLSIDIYMYRLPHGSHHDHGIEWINEKKKEYSIVPLIIIPPVR